MGCKFVSRGFYMSQRKSRTNSSPRTKLTRRKNERVVALVPAHNEQDIIGRTIESLINQTWPLSYILIIADNCSDRTVRIVRQYQKKYGTSKLRLMKTKNNKHKKAGALNQG